jgi:stress response protein SCP2
MEVIKISCSWQRSAEQATSEEEQYLDITVFGINATGEVKDETRPINECIQICDYEEYIKPISAEDWYSHHITIPNDGQCVYLRLKKIPDDISAIYILLSLYNDTLSSIQSFKANISSVQSLPYGIPVSTDNDNVMHTYEWTKSNAENEIEETGIILCRIFCKNQKWHLEIIDKLCNRTLLASIWALRRVDKHNYIM